MSDNNSKYNNVTQILPKNKAAEIHYAESGKKRCLHCMETYSDEYDVCPFCGGTTDMEVENALHMFPGTILHEKYIIGKVIGYGGFGVTYIAWDTVLNIKVAVKEYLPSEFSTRAIGQTQVTVFSGDKTVQFNDGMDKFIDEAKRLAKFRNEHGIVKIFDSFSENGTAYIVMEYLKGETLARRLEREHTIPVEEAISMLMPIIESLDKVHAEGIIHRDIAPDNIFLTDDGEVKLIDFGAARYATTSRSRSLTVIIKPGYSPEEQYRSRGDQGPHTDVYSVGACLYKMVTGETPPDAMERHATFEKSRRDMLRPIRKYVKDIDPDRENAIYNAMNVRIEDRTPDMVSLAGELLSDEPVKRRRNGIKIIDPLTWPLWAKIGIPAAMAFVVTLSILLAAGVIGPRSNLKSGIVIGVGETLVPDVIGTDVESAGKKFEANELNYVISNKIESEVIGRELIMMQDPDAFNVVDKGTSVELVKSDGLGDGTVPYVVGLLQEIAVEEMEAEGFTVKIVEQADDVIAPGYVISQSAKENTIQKREDVITLAVSTGNSDIDTTKEVSIPDLVGKTYDEAEEILNGMNLYLSKEYVYNAELPVNQIVGQFPEGGTDGHQGDVVSLTVNLGEEKITVIDVREKTLETAVAALEDLGLDVYTKAEENDLYKEGTVFEQSIAAGKNVEPGTKITLTYSSGKSVKVPDVQGKKIKDAEELIVAQGLTISANYEPSDTVKKDVVISQSPAGGKSAKKGDTIEVIVSSGANGGSGKSSKKSDSDDSSSGSGTASGGSSDSGSKSAASSAVLVSLTIESKPTKTKYTVGEKLDTSGLRIMAKYSDGTTKDVTDSCSMSETTFETASAKSIVATYKEGTVTKTATFAVTVSRIAAKFEETSYTIKIDSTAELTLTDLPDSAKVTWESKDKKIATVSDGKVTGVSVGSTTITATITVGSKSATATCTVNVSEEDIEAEKVTLDNSKITLYDNDGPSKTLTATITPTTVTNSKLTWKVADKSIATVSSDGVVKGVKAGETTVTVSTSNGKTDKCTVTVESRPIESIKITGLKSSYYITDKYKDDLKLTVTYKDGGQKTLTEGFKISSENTDNWNEKVTVTYEGKTATATVRFVEVNVKVSGESQVAVGGSITLTATTSPSGMKITKWESSDNNVATVSSKGVVTGLKAGAVTIKAYYGEYADGSLKITVINREIKNISIEDKPSSSELAKYYVGDTIPTDGISVKVTYQDGTTEVKTDGITLGGDGVFTKAAASSSGQDVEVKWGSEHITWNVKGVKLPSIKLNKTSISISEGKTETLKATTVPSGLKVSWDSKDNIATVDSSGNVTGTAEGTDVITAKIEYKGTTYTADCNVTVTGRTVKSISVDGTFKTENYYYGDEISTYGMKLTVTYNNGDKETVSNGFSVSPRTAPEKSGTNSITVNYGGKTASYTIKVEEPTVSLKINYPEGNNQFLYQGQSADITITKTPNSSAWSSGKWETISGSSARFTGISVIALSNKTGMTNAEYSAYYNDYEVTAKISVNVKEDDSNTGEVSYVLPDSAKEAAEEVTYDNYNDLNNVLIYQKYKGSKLVLQSVDFRLEPSEEDGKYYVNVFLVDGKEINIGYLEYNDKTSKGVYKEKKETDEVSR